MIFRKKLAFYGEGLLAPRPTLELATTPCRLSAAAYSIYSQLPCIAGGRPFHPQPEDASCCFDKGTHLRWLSGVILGNVRMSRMDGRSSSHLFVAFRHLSYTPF
jgi:hypothetical protein